MIRIFTILAFVTLFGACSSSKKTQPVTVQAPSPSERELVGFVETAINHKQWSQASTSLAKLKSLCKKAACGDRFNFTSAYYYHNHYLDSAARDRTDIDSAIFYYEQVLTLAPENISTYQNLALLFEASGQLQKALLTLRRAAATTNDIQYLYLTGDVLIRNERAVEAVYLYDSIIAADPFNRLAHERLVSLYAIQKVNPRKMLLHCDQLEQVGFTALSLQCLTILMNQHYREQPQFAESALVLWVYLSSVKRKEIDLYHLPREWNSFAIRELKIALDSVPPERSSFDFWNDRPMSALLQGWNRNNLNNHLVPKNVIAHALALRGAELLRMGRASDAERALQTAFKVVTGHTNYDNLYKFLKDTENIPDVFYKVAADLGMLYTQYPELPEAEDKFRRLEQELFDGKGAAYNETVHSSGIMKFHSTLGTIYANRNQWQNKNGRYKDAIFQLTSAIEKSPEGRNTSYWNRLLATGYVQLDQSAKAGQPLIMAAAHAMNDDDLDGARSIIATYDSLNLQKDDRYQEVVAILNFRVQLSVLKTFDAFENLDSLQNYIDGLTKENSPSYSHFLFYKRLQRYKILADLAVRAEQNGKQRLALYCNSLAIQQAYTLETLGNISDVVRLNAMKNSVLQTVSFTISPKDVTLQNGVINSTNEMFAKHSWTIYETSSFSKKIVEQNEQLLVGAYIAEVIATTTTPQTIPLIHVGETTLLVEKGTPALLERMKDVSSKFQYVLKKT